MNFTIRCTLALGVAAAAICCSRANAADIELTTDKLIIRDALPENPLKRKILWRVKDPAIVIGARGSADDPRCVEEGGSGTGGTIRFFSDRSGGSTEDTGVIPLPCENWRRIGNAAHPKGYRYVDRRQEQGPCKSVQVKGGRRPSLRATCTGRNPSSPLDYDLTVGTDEGTVGVLLTVGTIQYCTASDDSRGRDGSNGMIFYARNSARPTSCLAPCDCCTPGLSTLTFAAAPSSGPCGRLSNFRCSNASTTACSTDSDCRFGPCFTPPGSSGFCSNNFAVPCSGDAECQGTCSEQSGIGLPQDLFCGRTYSGGSQTVLDTSGGSAVPEGWESRVKVVACDGKTGELTLGPTTAADTGSAITCTQGRRCSNDNAPCAGDQDCAGGTCEDRCFFGPVAPQPLADPLTASSLCGLTVVAEDVAGTAQCDGGQVSLTLTAVARLYKTGDLLSATNPPDVQGIQPCPLCVHVCQGGAKSGFPCGGDTECPGGSCSASTQCVGGANDGGSCVPGTADLGEAFPTSHDCPPAGPPSVEMLSSFALGSVRTTVDAVDHADAQRVFCGFCFDPESKCFAGDPDPQGNKGCPLPGDGTAVPCTSDADCTAPYASCGQHSPGAFHRSGATRIELFGSSDGQCLADPGTTHDVTLGGFFCIPPTFVSWQDGGVALPGPGVSLLSGRVSLSP